MKIKGDKMFIIGIIASGVQVKQIKKEIEQENLNAKVIWINAKSIENIRNIKFEIVIMQNLSEKLKDKKINLKKILKNSKYLLLNTDLIIEQEMFEGINAKIITYGLRQKATITTSSIEEKLTIVSIQRAFENLQGELIEMQEIPTQLKNKGVNNIYNSLIKTAIINIYGTKKP